SSRRRHTRSTRDWSSDVCSSDLNDRVKFEEIEDFVARAIPDLGRLHTRLAGQATYVAFRSSDGDIRLHDMGGGVEQLFMTAVVRSEERRVGKESGCQWRETYIIK